MSCAEDMQNGYNEICSMFVIDKNSNCVKLKDKWIKHLLKDFSNEYTKEVGKFISEQKLILEQQDEFLTDDEIYFMNKIDVYLVFNYFLAVVIDKTQINLQQEEVYIKEVKISEIYGNMQKSDLLKSSREDIINYECILKVAKEMSNRIYEEKINVRLENCFER